VTEAEWLASADPTPMLEFLRRRGTESEWLACANPRELLVYLEGEASDRKARLFGCGLARSLWPYLGDDRSHHVVEVAERHADKLATDAELATAGEAALDANRGPASRIASWVGDKGAWQAARMIVVSVQQVQMNHEAKDWAGMFIGRCRALLRCTFGNPFRPSPPLPPAILAWHDSTVRRLAEAIYEDRKMPEGTLNTGRLAILADAVLDAGCDNEDLIAHCRSEGPHVRGCWAVDLILGKESSR
jgi:hypothetical protein